MTPNAGVCSKNHVVVDPLPEPSMSIVLQPLSVLVKRRGVSGSDRIFAVLDGIGVSAIADLAQILGIHRKTVAYHVQSLEREGALIRTKWGREILVHRPSVPKELAVLQRMMQIPPRRRMLLCLVKQPTQQKDLARITGTLPSIVMRWLNEFHRFNFVQINPDNQSHFEATDKLHRLLSRLSR